MSTGQDGTRGTGVFLGGRYSYDDLVAFGGIPENSVEVRASNRIRHQHNADATQMERAQQLAAAKNCGAYAGTHSRSKFSLSYISDTSFLSRTSKLGICLGASNDEIAATILNIKRSDNERTLIMLSKNIDEKIENDREENGENEKKCEIFEKAASLSMDLTAEEQLGSDDIANPPISLPKITRVYKRREKVIPTVVRRSSRLKKNI
jgi:hypothetical protein